MSSSPFCLYYATYSICATMVRTTFAMRGPPREGLPDMDMRFQLVDISPENPEQLSEDFLCKVNRDGQVPVLTNEQHLTEPMPESVDISYYICDWYPQLLPKEHEAVIRSLVQELHQINYGVLTFGPGSRHPTRLVAKVEELLEQPGLSESYRSALERKAKILRGRQGTLTVESLAKHEAKTRELCSKVLALMEKHGSEPPLSSLYIFGDSPTVLDAHMLPFLCRVVDGNRSDLIEPALLDWLEKFRKGGLWTEIVPGGSTLPPYASS
ncbi:hypothetical protein PFICI_01696 [Pestalotiopsis fici W106-1]|uniref:GST N-terminal domain-containing protein n=1 Tax=Pestalotiopsis fici (strain W106-1 / CGMCC3.15140) TaxID=1229662 RepID=W3XP82_PESFW|nr:uncharacterized protein PFICI_01696 [Pestalotiopsis fici W106-1]ETS87868.1 hypothetical protein PFICI_01696 [Pestalotiopsis fici W106-1]